MSEFNIAAARGKNTDDLPFGNHPCFTSRGLFNDLLKGLLG